MQPAQASSTTEEAQLDEQADSTTAAAVDTVSLLRELPRYIDITMEDILCPAGQATLPLLFAVSPPSSTMLLLLALRKFIHILGLCAPDRRACFSFLQMQPYVSLHVRLQEAPPRTHPTPAVGIFQELQGQDGSGQPAVSEEQGIQTIAGEHIQFLQSCIEHADKVDVICQRGHA